MWLLLCDSMDSSRGGYTAVVMKAFSVALVLAVSTFVRLRRAAVEPAPARDAQALTHRAADRHPSSVERRVVAGRAPRCVFVGARGHRQHLCRVDRRERPGRRRAQAITRFADGLSGGLFWSADSQRVYFPRQGDLWQVAAAGGEPAAVWTTPQPESTIVLSPDGSRVAFVRDGTDLVVRVARGWERVGRGAWRRQGRRRAHLVARRRRGSSTTSARRRSATSRRRSTRARRSSTRSRSAAPARA